MATGKHHGPFELFADGPSRTTGVKLLAGTVGFISSPFLILPKDKRELLSICGFGWERVTLALGLSMPSASARAAEATGQAVIDTRVAIPSEGKQVESGLSRFGFGRIHKPKVLGRRLFCHRHSERWREGGCIIVIVPILV